MELNDTGEIGIIGLGLMGSSIAAALLIHGQKVIALSPVVSSTDQAAPERIMGMLEEIHDEGLSNVSAKDLFQNVTFTMDYTDLASCWLVIECVLESFEAKKAVFQKVECHISHNAIIASNTSAIPISSLQQLLSHPERFFGMHWASPAYTSGFLEIICGDHSSREIGAALYAIAQKWGKSPTLVQKDIRGFISNRLMYAMYREAFYLVENGYATIADVDRACMQNGGQWMTFCGPFRFMDLTGLQAYHAVMQELFSELSNQDTVPRLIDDLAKAGGNGISNGKGFYQYDLAETKKWETAFKEFSFDINRLSKKYAEKLDDSSSKESSK